MLMSRSAPQPAIKKTPRGGTAEILSQRRLSELGRRGALTEDRNNNDDDGRESICHFRDGILKIFRWVWSV